LSCVTASAFPEPCTAEAVIVDVPEKKEDSHGGGGMGGGMPGMGGMPDMGGMDY